MHENVKGQPCNIITIMKSLDHQRKSRVKNRRRELFDNYRKPRFISLIVLPKFSK